MQGVVDVRPAFFGSNFGSLPVGLLAPWANLRSHINFTVSL